MSVERLNPNMKVEIIAIGDEVLRAETSGDNASWISHRVTAAGHEPCRITVLPDRLEVIRDELREAAGRSGIVVVTGGLGPTVDDVTRQAAIEAFGGKVDRREDIMPSIESRFSAIGKKMPKGYRDLARIPSGSVVLENSVGAAPGLEIRSGKCTLFLLPGVPAEMTVMFDRYVATRLSEGSGVRRSVIGVFGMMETEAEDLLKGLFDDGCMKRISIIAGPGGIRMYLPEELLAGGGDKRIALAFGSRLYSADGKSMEQTVRDLLIKEGLTLSVAESFTGGALASAIVSVPGASKYFMEGFVTYSDESKVHALGMDKGLLERHGAVSREVAAAMAEGARRVSGTDLAASTTGIAGPSGATDEKPAGLFYTGLSTPVGTYVRKNSYRGDRSMVRTRGVYAVLDMLRLWLSGHRERLE